MMGVPKADMTRCFALLLHSSRVARKILNFPIKEKKNGRIALEEKYDAEDGG